MWENNEVERICFNCNYFFPTNGQDLNEFGICLNDNEFEPYLDELIENLNYECCSDLINRKKFSGEQEACPNFDQIDFEEIDDDSELGRKLISCIESGQFSYECLKEIIIEERIRNINLKTLPVEQYVKRLYSPNLSEKMSAIRTLGGLISLENKAAFDELFKYLKQLPPPKTIQDVHIRIEVLHHLNSFENRKFITNHLLGELYKTPSNNTTRQWISAIFDFIRKSSIEDIREPLEKMLKDKRFSYRLKKKIKDILYGINED